MCVIEDNKIILYINIFEGQSLEVHFTKSKVFIYIPVHLGKHYIFFIQNTKGFEKKIDIKL